MNGESLQLLMPLVGALFTVAAYLVILYRKIGTLPVLDAGTVAVLFTSLYVIVPLLAFLLCGMEPEVLRDRRLIPRPPSAEGIAAIAWRYDLYLAALCFAYLALRRWDGDVAVFSESLSPKTAAALFGVWSLLTLLFILLAANGSFPSFAKYEDVLEAYSSRLKWALWQRQVVNHFEGMYVVVVLALLAFVLKQYQEWRWRVLFYLWVVVEMSLPLFFGSRAKAVFFGLGAILLFNRLVRPLNRSFLVGIGGLSLLAFLWIGVFRSGIATEAWRSALMSNEFQAVFVNAYDIHRRINDASINDASVEYPRFFHFFELLLLVPQQLLPFVKPDPAMWYASLFGSEEIRPGQGLAFGVVAQSVIGFDHVELIIRGFLTGAGLAMLHRLYVAHSTKIVWVLFYVWLCAHVYLTVRLYSFALVPKFVFQFMPIALLVSLLEKLDQRATLSRKAALKQP